MTEQKYSEMLQDLLDKLPELFFKDLNLGVVISDELKMHPASWGDTLFITGEYRTQGVIGRQIMMYRQCFDRRYG